jgi:ribosomal protein L11 methyltransferase
VPEAQAESARAAFVELFPEGFEEVSGASAVELAAYTDAVGERRLRARFPAVDVTLVADDWHERWREFHRPVTLGSLWIGPPWRHPEPGLTPVVIDPGRAFGTGAHDTTRLCLELLEGLPRGSLLDVGSGSGVLAIAAAKIGFAPVTAMDSDANAVEATRENANRNGVRVVATAADALLDRVPEADVAVANISFAAVQGVLPRLRSGWAVISGYRAEDRFRPEGWEVVERRVRGGWAADVLRRATG